MKAWSGITPGLAFRPGVGRPAHQRATIPKTKDNQPFALTFTPKVNLSEPL